MADLICTSFSPKGYDVYGRRFLESFDQFWPEWIGCVVYYEKDMPDFRSERVEYRDLMDDKDLTAFLAEHSYLPRGNYRFDALKFCRKVYAYTDPKRPKSDIWAWVDADVETIRRVTLCDWTSVLPDEGQICSYLGRTGWHHSECGFMAFRDSDFLPQMRELYDSGAVFAMTEWHDSFVFDRLRDAYPAELFKNLSEGVPGMHVWPHTRLNFTEHRKGPEAKVRAYGVAA